MARGSIMPSRRRSISPRCVGSDWALSLKFVVPGSQWGREKIAAEEQDTHWVELQRYSDRTEVRAIPHPRSLANLKWGISEKKWVESCEWAGGRPSKTKYRIP